MSSQYFPLVYWAQTADCVTLRIDLQKVEKPALTFDDNRLSFFTAGIGAHGFNNYGFSLNLYDSLVKCECNYRIIDTYVLVTLKKTISNNWWPRLVTQPQKPHWLRIDFDRWRYDCDKQPDNISNYDIDEEQLRNILEDYPDIMKNLEKEEIGYRREHAKTVYLIMYNLIQFIGFLYIFIVMNIRFLRYGIAASMNNMFDAVGPPLKFVQITQYLEVMHPMFGYTKGSPIIPFMQISGRAFVLFCMVDSEPRMQSKPVVTYLICVWTLIELVRYPYYLIQLAKLKHEVCFFVKWLRYTLWIPLYPLGFICEGIIMLRNIPYFEESGNLTIKMPNAWNISFSMTLFIKCYLICGLAPGIYFVMNHMRKLRAKKLYETHIRKMYD